MGCSHCTVSQSRAPGSHLWMVTWHVPDQLNYQCSTALSCRHGHKQLTGSWPEDGAGVTFPSFIPILSICHLYCLYRGFQNRTETRLFFSIIYCLMYFCQIQPTTCHLYILTYFTFHLESWKCLNNNFPALTFLGKFHVRMYLMEGISC